MNIYNADLITKHSIYYTCPYCWNKYNRDGKPRKNAVNIQHHHGSCGNKANREECRSSHCPIQKGEIIIIINDDTVRK